MCPLCKSPLLPWQSESHPPGQRPCGYPLLVKQWNPFLSLRTCPHKFSAGDKGRVLRVRPHRQAQQGLCWERSSGGTWLRPRGPQEGGPQNPQAATCEKADSCFKNQEGSSPRGLSAAGRASGSLPSHLPWAARQGRWLFQEPCKRHLSPDPPGSLLSARAGALLAAGGWLSGWSP